MPQMWRLRCGGRMRVPQTPEIQTYQNADVHKFEIVTQLLYNLVKPVHDNYWEEGLVWLRTHRPEEPNFRQSLILKIKHELEDDVTDCFEDLLKTCVECAKAPKDETLLGLDEFNPDPIWILPFLFDILYPNLDPPKPGHKGTSLQKCISRRIRLF